MHLKEMETEASHKPLKQRDTLVFSSPLGPIEATYSEDGLSKLAFVEGLDPSSSDKLPEFMSDLVQQFDAYLNGDLKCFDIPLDIAGTSFQQEVWALLSEIPYGVTISYNELSKRYGDEKAIRAIASANGANPVMILIPCHRVIGTDGSLTGYAGGLWRKEFLLDLETGVQRLF